MESATENNRHAYMFLCALVRVKTCGKSARACLAIAMRGKPYLEQGK